MKDIFLKFMFSIQKNYVNFIMTCHFYQKEKKIRKVEKFVSNLYDKNKYDIHIRNLKQALTHGLILKKVHRMIKFNQKDQLKTFVDMNTKLRQKAKNDFQKDFFKLMNNAVSGKTMENVKKYRDIKPVTTERRRNYLVSEPNYHTTKFFKENIFAIGMKKTHILINMSVYLGSILDLRKTVMYEFWHEKNRKKT